VEAATVDAATETPAASTEAGALLKWAGLLFLGAVAAAIVAAGWSLKVVHDGGSIRYYIFILPLLLLWRAFTSYRAAVGLGGKVKAPILAVAALAAVVAVAAVGYSAKAALIDGPSADTCWHDESATKVVQVDCDSDKADWVATSEVTDASQCADDYLESDGKFLCIEAK
jgi:hypothetical protein